MSPQTSITPSFTFAGPLRPVSRAAPAFTARRASLVIADDNELLRELLACGLTERGYSVRCAEDGESGWESLFLEPFDLLITDQQMPRLTGLGLLRRMRESSLKQPAILISGNMPRPSIEVKKLLSPGASLAKPFSLGVLIPLIEVLLDRSYGRSSPRTQNRILQP